MNSFGYDIFIGARTQFEGRSGFDPTWFPDRIFAFQRALVEWACRKGRAALFEDVGLGKSVQELAWAENVIRRTNKPVLLLTPLAVGAQMVMEAEKFGVDARRSKDGNHDGAARVVIANYQRLHLFSPGDFAGLVADECFPRGTMVDTFENGCILKKPIETVRHGQTIINAAGRDTVIESHRRKINRAVAVAVGGRRIVASENHPFFTQRGWVPAIDLADGDAVMETTAAMRLVSRGIHAAARREKPALLREILLSEMEDAADKHFGMCSRAGSGGEAGAEKGGVVSSQQPRGIEGERANEAVTTFAGVACEDEPDIAEDRPQTFRAWRKWDRDDHAAILALGGSSVRMGARICRYAWPEDSRISVLLQSRSRASRAEIVHRGGWSHAQEPEGSGREERFEAGFVGVDSIEILELGHPELDQWRDAEGIVYFYDLKAARHPSFSVEGFLVHNSGILKNADGVTRAAVIKFASKMPYRLLATATPSPNDLIELGNSSEALSYLGFQDMLGKFFKKNNLKGRQSRSQEHRPGNWRFRGHAESDFWRWVTSWARAIRKPSDIGFEDTGYILPPLDVRQHIVQAKSRPQDWLFDMPAVGLREQRAERRRTIKERCEVVAELVNSTGQPFVSWCALNPESEELARCIPDAREVTGSQSDDEKEEILMAFSAGEIRGLVSKSSICGFGLNWQHCAHQTFFPSHSYEAYHQSVGRSRRFGQKKRVRIDVVTSEGESEVLANLQRKTAQAEDMFSNLSRLMNDPNSVSIDRSHNANITLPSWLTA